MNGLLIQASESVGGNIGSCQVHEVSGFVDVLHRQVYFINSCTGEILNSNLYFEWPLAILFGVFAMIIGGIVIGGIVAAWDSTHRYK